MHTAASLRLALIGATLVLPATSQLSLFASGKPQLGKTLRLEVSGAPASPLSLLIDTAPGPITIGGTTFGVGFSPTLLVVPLGTLPNGAGTIAFDVPDLPALDGATIHFDVASASPLQAAGGLAIPFATPLPLAAVNDFAYRLQGANGHDLPLAPLANSAFDLCVVDYSRDGLDEFSAGEIASLRSAAEPDRIRLAYMSIGEAEDYRWYWNLITPSLVLGANPMWPGNFKVEFWQPEWKDVILYGNTAVGESYIDRVLDQGFDGVYLDIIDAFEFFGPAESGGQDLQRDAAAKMADFVVEMAFYARIVRGHPDFLVVPQNGVNIIDPEWYPPDTLGPTDPATPAAMAAATAERLLTTIDAVGTEDIFFSGNADVDNPYAPDTYLLGLLDTWQAAGALVLSTEYLTQSGKIDALYDTYAPGEGVVPYATVRDLDKLTINAGHEPD